ncbi:glutathione transferase GstA [Pseudomonas chlororaphis]|uniref:glutathione transferase GstA n=1 Tax=Pseudomonas chlororaphis TaxID=587753 RepID=UPI0023680707|nr:glutathione transferase GstA [Pseudomonas chlororaphis]WDG76504.1 glutathione transferase GstA [Pseudomonas chlororaphis]WDG84257.1 glutathione transferase GstA [Pseudomonas chlororaphis]
MNLYFSPNACSLAPHIVLRELALPFNLVRVDNRNKTTADGADFLAINPKGYVAALELEDGQVLTEGPAILQYLADLKPHAGLAPANGSWQRVRLQEMLNFVSSEIHGGLGWLFNPEFSEATQALIRQKLFKRLALLDRTLEQQSYLLGESFGVADAYLFTVLRWTAGFAIDLEQWSALARFQARIAQREAVQAALTAETAL